MPEAIKETAPEAPQAVLKEEPIEKLPCKEVGRAEEASSGTLPVDDKIPSKEVGEGAVAPDVQQVEPLEEGKNIPDSNQVEKKPVEGNGTAHENDLKEGISKSEKESSEPMESSEAPDAKIDEPSRSAEAESKTSSISSEEKTSNELPSVEKKAKVNSQNEVSSVSQPEEAMDLDEPPTNIEKLEKTGSVPEESTNSKISSQECNSSEGMETEAEPSEKLAGELKKDDSMETDIKKNDAVPPHETKVVEPSKNEEMEVNQPSEHKKTETSENSKTVDIKETSKVQNCDAPPNTAAQNERKSVTDGQMEVESSATEESKEIVVTSKDEDKSGVKNDNGGVETKEKETNQEKNGVNEVESAEKKEENSTEKGEDSIKKEEDSVKKEKDSIEKDKDTIEKKDIEKDSVCKKEQDSIKAADKEEKVSPEEDKKVVTDEKSVIENQVSETKSSSNSLEKEDKDKEVCSTGVEPKNVESGNDAIKNNDEPKPSVSVAEEKKIEEKTDIQPEQKPCEVENSNTDNKPLEVVGDSGGQKTSVSEEKSIEDQKTSESNSTENKPERNSSEIKGDPKSSTSNGNPLPSEISDQQKDSTQAEMDASNTADVDSETKKEITAEQNKEINDSMKTNSKNVDDKQVNGEKAVDEKKDVGNEGSDAGSSRSVDPKTVEEVNTIIREAKAQMATADYFTAADLLGKACEIAGKLYGDLAKENAELYYLYGCAMLECAKNENPVLGEAVKDAEEESEAVEESDNQEEADDEKMEVDDEKMAVDKDDEPCETKEDKAEENGTEVEANGEEGTNKESDEDEDSSLKVAWEMFELAKLIFTKTGNDLRLSDTYIKLGEVGMESGHQAAVDDMKSALDLRKKCANENERLIAETHFNIGLAYATFQSFDEAIDAFKVSKSILQSRIDKLKATNDQDPEIKEINEIFPDLDDKIADMEESKKAKSAEGESSNGEKALIDAAGSSKPVSNISHLVKRKRKLEEVATDLLPSSKQQCTEIVPEPESTNKKDSCN